MAVEIEGLQQIPLFATLSSEELAYVAAMTATRPSCRSRRRSCANGGRKTYRHRRSSLARSFADTHTWACRSDARAADQRRGCGLVGRPAARRCRSRRAFAEC